MKLNASHSKMKKRFSLVSVLTFVFCLNLHCQFSKNTLMLGGDLDFFLESSAPVAYEVNLLPTLGYFLFDDFLVGLQLNAFFTNRGDSNNSAIGFGPMARYYLGNDRISAFGNLSYIGRWMYSSGNEEGENIHAVFPGIGMNYMFTPTVGIETMLGVYLGQVDPTISLGFGFQIFIPPNIN